MTPVVMQDVPAEEFDLFQKICLVMRELPDIDLGEDLFGEKIHVSCHMVTRALAAHFPVTVKDGFVLNHGWPHSWLETESGLIIDPYPIALVGGPVMVFKKSYGSPWMRFYVERDCMHPQCSQEPFLGYVAQLTEAVGMMISRLRKIVPALL